MAEAATDLLMQVSSNGRPLSTGSSIDLTVGSSGLLDGFENGTFCVLSSFSMGAGGAARPRQAEAAEADVPDSVAAKGPGTASAPRRAPAEIPPTTPGEPRPVTFRRRLDGFSPRLFRLLAPPDRLWPSLSVAIVKRKAAGGASSGDAYLRLDFAKALLVSLEWEDDEEGVAEVGRFVYLDLAVRYRPQLENGKFGANDTGSYTSPPARRKKQ